MRRCSLSGVATSWRCRPLTAPLTWRSSTRTFGANKLAEMAGGDFKTNTLIVPKAAPSELSDFEDPGSIFGPAGDTIPALQSRGVVFMACHNAIWEMTGKLLAKGVNPDRLSHEAVAAELTNHLIDG